jgi:hypothetical protein
MATSLGVTSRKHTSQFHPTASVYNSKRHTKLHNHGDGDDGSERYILELEDRKTEREGITKTTHVSIREGDAQSHKTMSLGEDALSGSNI